VADKPERKNDYEAAIRKGRERLLEQIRKSEDTIKGSKEIIRRMDELLAKSKLKP
jgi:hypothetical protein